MPEPRDSRPTLWTRARRAVADRWVRLWRHGSRRMRDRLTGGDGGDDGDAYVEARARFWDELREGQRHAEAHSGKRDA